MRQVKKTVAWKRIQTPKDTPLTLRRFCMGVWVVRAGLISPSFSGLGLAWRGWSSEDQNADWAASPTVILEATLEVRSWRTMIVDWLQQGLMLRAPMHLNPLVKRPYYSAGCPVLWLWG